jgi:hypothetical protein
MLDCCHSSSGTRLKTRIRGTVFREPGDPDKAGQVTIPGDYDIKHWSRFYRARSATLDERYRHAGLGSHVLLAACGMHEEASDDFSFTTVVVVFLTSRSAHLDMISYEDLIKRKIGHVSSADR